MAAEAAEAAEWEREENLHEVHGPVSECVEAEAFCEEKPLSKERTITPTEGGKEFSVQVRVSEQALEGDVDHLEKK